MLVGFLFMNWSCGVRADGWQKSINRSINWYTTQDIYVVADSANLFSGAQMVDGKRNMDIKGAYLLCVCIRGA